MNVVLNVSVGSITFTLDATNANPDTVHDFTGRAIQFFQAVCTAEDLTAAAREPVLIDPDPDDD